MEDSTEPIPTNAEEASEFVSTNPEDNLKIIDAHPTKELFIYMLVRDLPLIDAICDLVDNSVDGARKIRTDKNYEGLYINIEFDENHFSVFDNCGGIDVALAEKYAFRFGRPIDAPETPNTIGQFGIGMKRALFKIGTNFNILTSTLTESFEVEVDVNIWKVSKYWNFLFKNLKQKETRPPEECGTNVTVTNLNIDTKGQFTDPLFVTRLRNKLELRNSYTLHNNLTIRLNSFALESKRFDFLESNLLQTAFWKNEINQYLSVQIYAGISDAKLSDGGWYIFGNERLIIGPDQSSKTGWGTGKSGIPVYHNQYERFRGIVLFESVSAIHLPWNTSKNDVDIDSPEYKTTLSQMIIMARPIIDFLNKLKEERGDFSEGDRILEKALLDAAKITLAEVNIANKSEVFSYPPRPPKDKDAPVDKKITYSKPHKQIEEVKKSLGVSSLREVGEMTFDYYYQSEIE